MNDNHRIMSDLRAQRDQARDEALALVESPDWNPDDERITELSTRAQKLDADIVRLAGLVELQDAADQVDNIVARGMSGTAGPDRYEEFTNLLRTGGAGRVTLSDDVEKRGLTVANSGARVATSSGAGGAHRYLYLRAGIRYSNSDAASISGPLFGALSSSSATAEGGTKPILTDPTPITAELEAFARVTTLSEQVMRFGVGLGAVGRRLEAEVVNDINAATVADWANAAGTALAHNTSVSYTLDAGIATVAEMTGNWASLIVVNPADYPTVSGKSGADSGDDIGSKVSSFNGVQIAISGSVVAGTALIIDGEGWGAWGTPPSLVVAPKLETNEHVARAERFFGLMPIYEGAAVAVDLTAA